MVQVTRSFTDCETGSLVVMRLIILARDSLCPAGFRNLLNESGVSVARLPVRSTDPNPSADAERVALSIKPQCIGRLIPLGEPVLRRAVKEQAAHNHLERHHQRNGGRLIEPRPADLDGTDDVRFRERLGGILNFHYREAASGPGESSPLFATPHGRETGGGQGAGAHDLQSGLC